MARSRTSTSTRSFSADDKGIFMNSTLVDKISKNKLEEIRISILKNNKIDVRIYFYFPNEPEPKPTKKGIWLSFKHIPKMLKAFDELVQNPEKLVNVELEGNEKDQIKVYSAQYMGKNLIHIRQFYLKEGEFMPGRGVSFSSAALPQIIEGFKKAATYEGKI